MDCPTLPKIFFRSISWPPQVGPNEKSLRRCGGFGNNANENSTGQKPLNALGTFALGRLLDFAEPSFQRLENLAGFIEIEAVQVLPERLQLAAWRAACLLRGFSDCRTSTVNPDLTKPAALGQKQAQV
jgi:hypothetical protein